VPINWYPGHMAQTLRALKTYLRQVDLVLETSDARIPRSSRNPELNSLLGDKPRLLILNKADLADPDVTARWLAGYAQIGITALACDSTNRSGLTALRRSLADLSRVKSEKAQIRGRLFRPFRVMVAGIPNTGKSTLINALCGRKLAKTADKPGVTRQISWIRSGGVLELLDSPGVLWPRLGDAINQRHLAATGAIRDELLPVEEVAAETLQELTGLYPDLIQQRYGLDEQAGDPQQAFNTAALRRGCLSSGGRPDTTRFAVLFLDELRSGRIGRVSLERPDDPV